MALPEDSYRVQQIFGTFAAEGHPMGKFTWGNESTLNTGIPDEALHTKLHELRLKYYSGHHMTLAVQARLSLDDLQELVCNIFSQVRVRVCVCVCVCVVLLEYQHILTHYYTLKLIHLS